MVKDLIFEKENNISQEKFSSRNLPFIYLLDKTLVYEIKFV